MVGQVYVCLCLCIYIYEGVYFQVCLYMSACVFVFVSSELFMYVWVCVCMHVYECFFFYQIL